MSKRSRHRTPTQKPVKFAKTWPLLFLAILLAVPVFAAKDNFAVELPRSSNAAYKPLPFPTPRDLAYYIWPMQRNVLASEYNIHSWEGLLSAISSDTQFAADLSRDFHFGIPGARETGTGQYEPLGDTPYGAYWNPYYLVQLDAATKMEIYQKLKYEMFDDATVRATLIRDMMLRDGSEYMEGFTRHPIWQRQSPYRDAILAAYGDPARVYCFEEPWWWIEDGHVRFQIGVSGYQDFKPVSQPPANYSVVPPEPVNRGTSMTDNSTWMGRIPWNAGVVFGGREFCKVLPREVVDAVGSELLGAYNEVLGFAFPHGQRYYFYKLTPERYDEFVEAAKRIHAELAAYSQRHNATWNMDSWSRDFYEPAFGDSLPFDVAFPSVGEILITVLESGGNYTAKQSTELFAREIFEWFRLYGPYEQYTYQYDYYWRELFNYYMPELKPMFEEMRGQMALGPNRYIPVLPSGASSMMEFDSKKLASLSPVEYPKPLPPIIPAEPPEDENGLLDVVCFGADCPLNPAQVLAAYTIIGAALSGGLHGLLKRRKAKKK